MCKDNPCFKSEISWRFYWKTLESMNIMMSWRCGHVFMRGDLFMKVQEGS
jgi:hypothetical protein